MRRQIRRRLPPSTPATVRLPAEAVPLVGLSRLLRVRKRTLVRTLRSLGERIAYVDAKQDSYTISVDMVELICIEVRRRTLPSDATFSELSLTRTRVCSLAAGDRAAEAREESE